MSYRGQSNAPWQRNVMQGHPQEGGFHQGSQMYMQNNMAFGNGDCLQGGSGGNMFPGGLASGNSVSYPQPRSGLNPVAFQQAGSSQTHYNSIGTVTKISNDCGLVNDEVFFYRNACKGSEPKLGDRVIFEATGSNNGQFKWNATRVQLMQQSQSLNKNSYSSIAPPSDHQRAQMRRNSPRRSPVRGKLDRDHRDRARLHRSRDRDEDEHERKRRREDRSHDRGVAASVPGVAAANEGRGVHAARNEKSRDRADSRKMDREVADRDRDRERERIRNLELNRVGPMGRRARTVKRYMVKMPKTLLTIKTTDVQELRQRYTSLYVPSDFFLANVKWSDTFTPDNPFSLRRPCQFHILHEMVESPTEQNLDLLEPPDSNYLYSAKVMLMSLPTIGEIYKKCFENNADADHHAVHPSRLINFLVGVKGRVGSMAIGGPWSPSLDGKNPDKDPSVLIRTAIRTCKSLTGIDLSNCTQWYRFVELYYHRTEYKNMEKDGPPRVETVVIYLPDVHSCMPSIEEWQTLTQVYKNAADGVIARRSALVAAAAANSNDDNDKSNDVEMADNSTLADDVGGGDSKEKSTENDETSAEDNDEGTKAQNDEEPEEQMEDATVSVDLTGADDSEEERGDAENEEQAEDKTVADDENDEPAPEPTHYSLLDLKTMKVQDIRDELLARNLLDKGVRNVVMARLAKALNIEKAEESKNKNKNKQHHLTQKTVAVRKTNETAGNNVNEKAKSSKFPSGKKNVAKAKNENAKEDKQDWGDIIDFELSDIVILDEYDSTKNTEEANLKEMSEKEKIQLIRHHTLPSSPHIVVHPNRQAKGGNFDCAVLSLSVLLDYHPDDSKERFFEVSLFAELFNEMLMRDFGFNIYKEIYLHEEPANTNNVSEITKNKADGDVKVEKSQAGDERKKESKEKDDEKEKSSKKDPKSSNENKSGKEQHNDGLPSNKSESHKRKISISNSTANGKDHDIPSSDKKMVVVKPELLLSFVYFDTTHCGYIFDKHLEDLFYVLGLNLSRSQIRNVLGKLGKLVSPHPIYYRKLTDKEESLVATPAIENIGDMSFDEHKQIAAGNNRYESIFGRNSIHHQVSAIEGDGDSKDGLMNFNGTIVHVGKLLNQINRNEKNYSDLEKLYNDLLRNHSDLQKDHNKSTTKIKDLQAEIKNVSRKLTDANQDFSSLNRKFRDQNSTLSHIYMRTAPYFVREKDKDKDAKSEGTRDKDKNDKEKEKDKSKDKDCEKEKEIKKGDNKNKENGKHENEKKFVEDEKEKENAKDGKEKDKIKDDKIRDQEKVKDEKDKEKEKVKDEKYREKEKLKGEKDKEKEKVKDEKENAKDEKEKVKENKENGQTKNDKEKEIHKDDKQKEKTKDDKEKQTEKDDKFKQTPQKNIVEKTKLLTPAGRKPADSKPITKVIKKSDNVGTKK